MVYYTFGDVSVLESIMSFINSPFGSSLIASLIGGFFTYYAVRLTIRMDMKKIDSEDRKQERAVCLALKTELELIKSRHMNSIGSILNDHDLSKSFLYYYVVEEDYFSIFHANTSFIGKVRDDLTRESIVKAYISAKGMLDTFRNNNKVFNDYEEMLMLNFDGLIETQKRGNLNKKIEVFDHKLVSIAKVLKEEQSSTFASFDVAINNLNRHLSSF